MIFDVQKKIAAQTFVESLDTTKALKAAGIKATQENRVDVFSDTEVLGEIKNSLELRLSKLGITIDRVLEETASIAFAEPRGAIRVADKLKALDMLAKYLNIYQSSGENNSTTINFNNSNLFKVEFL